MGTVRVRMDRMYWLQYLKAAPLQQSGLQTIRMRLDPLKKRLILEEELSESSFRFFLPVRSLDSQDSGQDCTYLAYVHQLHQVLEKIKRHENGTIKLEFRTNTLTFQGLGRTMIIPVECKTDDETGKPEDPTEKNTKSIFNQTAFVAAQWSATPEFLEKLRVLHTPAIPFQVRNQSLNLLEETLYVYSDSKFSGSFPREPFLRFLQMLPLPSSIHMQISENQWIRLQSLDLNMGVDVEIRLNKPTHVFLPAKKPEIQSHSQSQNQNLNSVVVRTALKKIASILEQPYPLPLPLHVRSGVEGFELFTVDGSVRVRVVLPFAGGSLHAKKTEGWIQAKDVETICEWLDDNGTEATDCIEVIPQALKLQKITIPLIVVDQQTCEYTEQQSQLEEIYRIQQTAETADPEEYIHLLFGKVKDFAKHIGQVPGDMLHITSKAGIVNIAIDFQSLRTRKMSKRLAAGTYAMSLPHVVRVIRIFTHPQEADAMIRFTGIADTFAWFTVDSQDGRYDIWLPSTSSIDQSDQTMTETEKGLPMQDREVSDAATQSSVVDTFDIDDMKEWIGLDELKQQITRIVNYVAFERQRQKFIPVKETLPSLHMCFTGNPGTGKTMTARLLGRLFKQIGVLEKGHVVEVDRQKLIGQHIGHSEANLAKYIQQALGGVLFIDEAHALYKADSGKDYGHDIIHVLVKAMEDYRNQLVVIVAGYKKEMQKFLDSNIGLRDRIPFYMDFPDYTTAELVQIGKNMAKTLFYYEFDDGVEGVLMDLIERARVDETFGNARAVRNLIEQAVIHHANRMDSTVDPDYVMYTMLTPEDFTFGEVPKRQNPAVWDRLQQMVGLREVKDTLQQIGNLLIFDQRRMDMGYETVPPMMHMVFTGNSGTGKTTVARLVGEWLKEMKLLKRGHFVEVSAKDLVAGYVGQTVQKTSAKIREALGGVLFIDEAYALAKGALRQFGVEAIATLVKEMEEQRGNLVVILAGYKQEMADLFRLNPGLKSRIRFHLDFPDYQASELVEIFKQKAEQEHFLVPPEVEERLWEYFIGRTSFQDATAGNGRLAESVFEKARLALATRLREQAIENVQELLTFTIADLPHVPEAEV